VSTRGKCLFVGSDVNGSAFDVDKICSWMTNTVFCSSMTYMDRDEIIDRLLTQTKKAKSQRASNLGDREGRMRQYTLIGTGEMGLLAGTQGHRGEVVTTYVGVCGAKFKARSNGDSSRLFRGITGHTPGIVDRR
jgi:hypothetical protein